MHILRRFRSKPSNIVGTFSLREAAAKLTELAK
jgi:hypothetical protein